LSSVSSEKQRFQYKVDVEEMCTLNAGGDRVQGLSGEGISISEEEMISDEAKGSQTNTLDSKGSQTLGLSKCSYVEIVKNNGGINVDSPNSGKKVEGTVKEIELDENVESPRSGKKVEGLFKLNELANKVGIPSTRQKLDVPVKEKGLDEVSNLVAQEEIMGGEIMEVLCTNGLHADQLIPEVRHSKRVQDQLLEKKFGLEVIQMEGNALSNKNSFALLDNDLIVDLAGEMGVVISHSDFDILNLMKDLELARHALEKRKEVEIKSLDVYGETPENIDQTEISLLEWVDEDSEAENNTLVLSKKNKKKKQAQLKMESSGVGVPMRSKRTTPSVYRNKGGQEIPATSKRKK
jgi:hypothetical protein